MRSILFLFLIAAACLGCDPLANPVSGRLSFSPDTISFDTVFTGLGSATRELRAVNPGNEPLRIDRIWLGGGTLSPFRLNINGDPVTETGETVIAQGDSIFIFVEVTVDPVGGDLPLAVTDSVNFLSGSYAGRVILEAWGQDIRLVSGKITGNTVWTEGRPYVVDGSLFIDTLARLTLEPGTRVYMHHRATVTVAGALQVNGTADKRVIIATDRLEKDYTDVPGRWQGVRFLDCSHNNVLNHATIRNAEIAVSIEGSASAEPDLLMTGAILMHNTVASLAASRARVFAVNSLFAHSGYSTVSLRQGGRYEFIHCTVSNRWEYSFRPEPAMLIDPGNGSMPEVRLVNSVVSGSLGEELLIDASAAVAAAGFRADSSLVKVDTLTASWYSTALFRDVMTRPDPRFISESEWDFRPDTLSPLLDRAGRTETVAWPFDIRDKPRPYDTGADIGAFERQRGEKRKEEKPAR
ncbi:MAG TPA: hypothetical protein DIS74_06845 [Bacteroidales bacterium]|nr:hypothetical protein [Bacteroidales bacterium]